MNIPNYVARNARKYTRHEAVVAYEPTGVSRRSWGELNIHVNQFAHYLQKEHAIEDGDRVALFLPNTYAFIVAHFAIQRLGAIVVHLRANRHFAAPR
ncbi:MAG: acyl--CoA ligase [Gammaproteobacteria bacterium]|nr:acyl--CoA ligase [Gammaproteobacteria bacterium]